MKKFLCAVAGTLLLSMILCGCVATKKAPSVSLSETIFVPLDLPAEQLAENNIVSGGDFTEGLPTISGEETIVKQNAECGLFDPEDDGNYVLKCDTDGEWAYLQLGKYTFEAGHTYFLGYRINVTRYESGRCGVQTFRNTYQNGVTDGWVTKTAISTRGEEDSNFNCYVGTMNDPVLTCYIDDLVIIDMSELFDVIPTEEQMLALYEEYVALAHAGD